MAKQDQKSKVVFEPSLELINPYSAGIDLGSKEHYVGVFSTQERPKSACVRSFSTHTEGIGEMASWLKSCGVKTVAMEATGVFWLSVYEMLEQQGFEVCLIHAKYVKNVAGRKSDVQDCQWIQQLHSYGLLSNAFVPSDKVRELRSYIRHRLNLEDTKMSCIHRIHKALDMMNLKVHYHITDMVGVVGLQILRAIADGQTDANNLSEFHIKQMKASKEELRKSLEGNYRSEHVFALKQCLSAFDFYESQMLECDQQIEQVLLLLTEGFIPPTNENENQEGSHIEENDSSDLWHRPKKYARKNNYRFDVKSYLKELVGVDLTQVDGLQENTILTIIAETGLDYSKWKTAKHFTSWLRLAPQPKVSGGKTRGHFSTQTNNRANKAFRLAAWAVKASKSALGAFYRKIRAKKGSPHAIKATARKIATIFFHMMTTKQEFVKQSAEEFEEKYQQYQLSLLNKKATKLGFVLQKMDD
jgi:transposase